MFYFYSIFIFSIRLIYFIKNNMQEGFEETGRDYNNQGGSLVQEENLM